MGHEDNIYGTQNIPSSNYLHKSLKLEVVNIIFMELYTFSNNIRMMENGDAPPKLHKSRNSKCDFKKKFLFSTEKGREYIYFGFSV